MRCTSATYTTSPTPTQEKVKQPIHYPNAKVIVLDDDVNTFEHVVSCLIKIIPGMKENRAWELADQIDKEGAATVWAGPLEQAELYHYQLSGKGLTMAPIERF